MALIKCKECGGQVSGAAIACPTCGAKPPKKRYGLLVGLIALVFVLAIHDHVTKGPKPLASSDAKKIAAALPSPPKPPPDPALIKEEARLRALSFDAFCTKELPKVKKTKGKWPQPWGEAITTVMRVHDVRQEDLEAIREGGALVGMSKCGALAAWGRPERVNSTTNQRGTREQWVYGGHRNYLYFEGGRLTTIQN